jgi:trigger factor
MKEYLKEDIKERKLFDILLAENTIKTGKKENYLDLMAQNG